MGSTNRRSRIHALFTPLKINHEPKVELSLFDHKLLLFSLAKQHYPGDLAKTMSQTAFQFLLAVLKTNPHELAYDCKDKFPNSEHPDTDHDPDAPSSPILA